MPAHEITMIRQFEAMTKVRSVVEKHDPELAANLRLFTPEGVTPNSSKTPDQVVLYLAEAIAVLADVVDELDERSANTPKRGRPPKAREKEAS